MILEKISIINILCKIVGNKRGIVVYTYWCESAMPFLHIKSNQTTVDGYFHHPNTIQETVAV